MLKIDVHTHILPKDIPNWKDKFGYGGFITLDGLLWFCENCNEKLHEDYFQLEDITTQFQGVFKKFYGSEELRTCKKCGAVMEPPSGAS